MNRFIFNDWHVWQGNNGILMSDESLKQLREFATIDDCINWLYVNGDKPAARALNAYKHEGLNK